MHDATRFFKITLQRGSGWKNVVCGSFVRRRTVYSPRTLRGMFAVSGRWDVAVRFVTYFLLARVHDIRWAFQEREAFLQNGHARFQ